MNRFVKLVNFEVGRFFPFFVGMMLVLMAAQLVTLYFQAQHFVEQAQHTMRYEKIDMAKYFDMYGNFSMENWVWSEGFGMPLVGVVVLLALYTFAIWYRDWYGKSTIMYRLLMLPTARRNVYLAKLVTMMLFVLTVFVVQGVIIFIGQQIITSIVPTGLLRELSFFEVFYVDWLAYLYPKTVGYFLLTYGLGATIIAVLFTFILFERSYQWKGILFGLLYSVFALALLLLPIVWQAYTNMLYEGELAIVVAVVIALVFTLSFVVAKRLLQHKVTV